MNLKVVIGTFISAIFLASFSYVSFNAYHYFFAKHTPIFTIEAIEDGYCYKDTINGLLTVHDDYKINSIYVALDGKLCHTDLKVSKKDCLIPLTIDTKTLPDGKHSLYIEVLNDIYHATKINKKINFSIDNAPLHIKLSQPDKEYKPTQGSTIQFRLNSSKALRDAFVTIFNKKYPVICNENNPLFCEAFVPVACEQKPGQYKAQITANDNVNNTALVEATVQVIPSKFKYQTLQVNAEKVKREKQIGISNDLLEQELEILAQKSPLKKLWEGVFYPPLDIKAIATEFGTIRTTQENGRYQHKALDIMDLPKTVVWAPQSGIVIIKNRYALSGNTVVIDHGCSIFSLFYHLDNFSGDIEIGKRIKQGSPIGTLGQTGYTSGFHLHWEMRINNVAVNPLQWINHAT